MERKWKDKPAGVEVLDIPSEFVPRWYVSQIFDLARFGVPQVPVFGHVAYPKTVRTQPWHVHENCVEFIYCSAGGSCYESEGRIYQLLPGRMFVSRPREVHRQLERTKGYATYYMHFQPSGGETIRWFSESFAHMPRLLSCSRSISSLFKRIIAVAGRNDVSLGGRTQIQTLVRMLWLEILNSSALSVKRGSPKFINSIAERMRKEPQGKYLLDELVAESGVSKTLFLTLFKAAHGFTPHAYLLHCRIEAAKSLLDRGRPVKVVSDLLGFSTQQLFARTFRSFVGVSPMKWLTDPGSRHLQTQPISPRQTVKASNKSKGKQNE